MFKNFFIITFTLVCTSLFANTQSDEDYGFAPISENTIEQERVIEPLTTRLLSKAEEFLGTPYRFGNKGENRTDCSGFTQQVFKEFGISLPRSATEQSRYGKKIELKDLKVGDLLFYRTYKKAPSHVGIYAGDGKIIHASYRNKKVQYDAIDKGYYKKRFLYAKRIVSKDDEPQTLKKP